MSQLIFVEQKPMQGKEHVPEEGAVIGREGCEINLADPEVSRRHATIHVAGEQLSIEDLGSTNGTFVNGQQVQGTQTLSEGDEVRLGNTVWRVQPSSQATATADAPGAAPPQVTAARQVPDAAPSPPPQAPPAPAPPVPAPPTAQQPEVPKPPAPQPPAPGAARGDVPAPDIQPSAIRRVVPPPGGPAAFREQGPGRQKGSAATRLGATLLATIAVALTAAGVVAYYVIEPFEEDVSIQVEE
ncbi:MAG: FHA domain-containing protein [Thermoleophilaceae bacterium]